MFTGPNPETDDILKTGDIIPGLGRVTNLSAITREALNDSGQVAMFVIYTKPAHWHRNAPSFAPTRRTVRPWRRAGGIPTPEDTTINGTLNASDPDGNPLTYSIIANKSKENATIRSAATDCFHLYA